MEGGDPIRGGGRERWGLGGEAVREAAGESSGASGQTTGQEGGDSTATPGPGKRSIVRVRVMKSIESAGGTKR